MSSEEGDSTGDGGIPGQGGGSPHVLEGFEQARREDGDSPEGKRQRDPGSDNAPGKTGGNTVTGDTIKRGDKMSSFFMVSEDIEQRLQSFEQ